LPGQSDLIAYSINKEFGKQLNKINFIADRYTLDAQFTQNWDAEDQRWHPSAEMTFDIYFHGDSADGVTSTADSTVVRADLVNSATIETTFDSGSCIFISAQDNTADLTNKTADTTYITADNGIKSATAYKIIDKFNKYLIFPKIDIINTKQTT
jgi:hypothetical protein